MKKVDSLSKKLHLRECRTNVKHENVWLNEPEYESVTKINDFCMLVVHHCRESTLYLVCLCFIVYYENQSREIKVTHFFHTFKTITFSVLFCVLPNTHRHVHFCTGVVWGQYFKVS